MAPKCWFDPWNHSIRREQHIRPSTPIVIYIYIDTCIYIHTIVPGNSRPKIDKRGTQEGYLYVEIQSQEVFHESSVQAH